MNRKYSNQFQEEEGERKRYQRKHPTKIVVFKCMDGRCNVSAVTGTRIGLLETYRNIGGMFDFGWEGLSDNFAVIRSKAGKVKAPILALATYHYSEGSEKRGCAGFGHDREKAIAYMRRFRDQIERIYPNEVTPILVGIETDSDALILHGETEVVNLGTLGQESSLSLLGMIRRLYPKMPYRVVKDLLPLVEGNIAHIHAVKGRKLQGDLEHKESVLAIGCGFDWLVKPNLAIIVGPRSPNVEKSILKAAGIIKSNFDSGRVSTETFIVISSAIAAGKNERLAAIERANFYGHLTRDIIRDNFPDEFFRRLHRYHAVVDLKTREMEVFFKRAQTDVSELEEARRAQGQ